MFQRRTHCIALDFCGIARSSLPQCGLIDVRHFCRLAPESQNLHPVLVLIRKLVIRTGEIHLQHDSALHGSAFHYRAQAHRHARYMHGGIVSQQLAEATVEGGHQPEGMSVLNLLRT